MVSSIREKIWKEEKQKKVKRRLVKEGVLDAVEERQKPEDDQQEHQEVEIGEVSSEASSGDSIVESGEVKAKINKPKKKAKKASKKS
tara:strand:- start:2803 stop:3063 length:261 start_codon:yes stop_codon:yes gene_type:complete